MEDIFVNTAGALRGWFLGLGLPAVFVETMMALVYLAGILGFILLNVIYLVYLERKFSDMSNGWDQTGWAPRSAANCDGCVKTAGQGRYNSPCRRPSFPLGGYSHHGAGSDDFRRGALLARG